jgi:hypothetical protein
MLYASLPRPADSLSPIRRVPFLSFVPGSYTLRIGLPSSIALADTSHAAAPFAGVYIAASASVVLQSMPSNMGSRGSRAPNPFVRTPPLLSCRIPYSFVPSKPAYTHRVPTTTNPHNYDCWIRDTSIAFKPIIGTFAGYTSLHPLVDDSVTALQNLQGFSSPAA